MTTVTAPLPLEYGTNVAPQAGPQRLKSLDVFRGMTLAMMLLVNNPGSWAHIYTPLEHAEWDGCTPTDLVFPFFMFIVGVAIPLSIAARRRKAAAAGQAASETNWGLALNVVRRGLTIIALGLLLHLTPSSPTNGYHNLEKLRLFGVLQRIGLCYIPAGLLALWLGWRGRVAVLVFLLVTYTVLMMHVDVPGYGKGNLSLKGNVAAKVDRWILPNHIYTKDYDPEGLLSSMPAIATILLGTLAGEWLRTNRPPTEKSAGLFAMGVACACAGYVLDHASMPINKALWSPAFVLYTGGLGLLGFGFCHWLVDVQGRAKWSTPFVVFGVNPIFAFVASGIVGRLLVLIKWHRGDGKEVALRTWLHDGLFARLPAMSPNNASLVWALCYVGLFAVMLTVLYRRRIYIRV